jgi:hypothetical protein
MSSRSFLLFVVLFVSQTLVFGQTVADLVKLGNKLEVEGHLYDAAVLFEKAWRIKPQEKDLAFRAGSNFYFARDYKKAIDCLQAVKTEEKQYSLVGLLYARSLKREQRYREASEAFSHFLNRYEGLNKKTLEDVCVTEIKGCDYALELKSQPVRSGIKFEVLPEAVNSIEDEYAPIPITDDLLYFSSDFQGKAKIFRVQRKEGVWSRPELAKGLPKPVEDQFGNGCFSPDGTRFFFTQCKTEQKKGEDGKKIAVTTCNIYLTRRNTNGAWSEPEKLRDYINQPGYNNTQPFLYEQNGEEILLFASNREGSVGGLDLYKCSRQIDSPDLDFSLPVNLGLSVNTIGDEVSPFVDAQAGILYFSSNGHINIGGFDIYSIDLNQSGGMLTNLGLPYNSSSDDLGFTLKKSNNGGFLVSNRQALPQKVSTRHQDLFEFKPVVKSFELSAKAFDAVHQVSLRDLDVTLYEKDSDGQLQLLTMATFAEGDISFPIMNGKEYLIEIAKEGYKTQNASTQKRFETVNGYYITMSLEKLGQVVIDEQEPVKEKPKSKKPAKKIAPTPAPVSKPAPEKTADPAVFYVHLESVLDFDIQETKYADLSEMGKLMPLLSADDEYIRVYLGPFDSKERANQAARVLRDNAQFPQALVVRQ